MAATNRVKVLTLYRQILKFAKNWKVGDKSESAINERKTLCEEARQKFAANKGVSDTKEIGQLIQVAEARLAQAEHYGYPFERPKYLEPNTAFCEMSSTEPANTSPSDPEKENSESCGYGTPTGFSFNSMPIIFVQFARLFYAGSKVTDEMISELIQAAVENDEDAVRLSLIFASSIIQKYFIKKRYSRAVCKRFVDVMSASSSSSSHRRVTRADVEAAFTACNEDEPDLIKISQLKLVMRALGFEPRNAEIEKITEKVKGFANRSSWHGRRGMVDVDELMECIGERNNDKSEEEMKCAFRLFDREDKGWISLENLRTVSRELGEKLGDDELMEMLKEAAGGDGRVTEEHFAAVMKKTCLY